MSGPIYDVLSNTSLAPNIRIQRALELIEANGEGEIVMGYAQPSELLHFQNVGDRPLALRRKHSFPFVAEVLVIA